MNPKLIDTTKLEDNYIDLKSSIDWWLKGVNVKFTHKNKELVFNKDYITEYKEGKLLFKLLKNE